MLDIFNIFNCWETWWDRHVGFWQLEMEFQQLCWTLRFWESDDA